MQHAFRFWLFVLGAFAISSANALASKVVVPPLVPRSTPSSVATNMTTLVASELEFTGEFDTVIQLDTRPSQLGPNCLGSTPCLNAIAKSNGSVHLLGGKVTKYGAEYEVALTYLQNEKIVRTVKRRMSTDPAAIADEIAIVVRHAITGVDPEKKAQEDKISGFEGGGLALMDEEDEEDDDALLMAAPAVGAVALGGALGAADDFNEFEEDPLEDGGGYGGAAVAGAAAGGAAAAAASRAPTRAPARAAAPTRAPTPPPAPDPIEEDTFDPNAYSFGGSVAVIEAEDPIDLEIIQTEVGFTDQDILDEPSTRAPTRPTKTPRDRSSSRSPQGSSAGAISLTGRLGYARFQFLNFITYGIEASFQVQEVLAVVAGFDAHSTRRLIPPELVPVGQPAVQWNTLVPMSAGLLYKSSANDIRPYAGAGTSIIPGYVKDAKAVAFGFHARGGVDVMLSDNVGINVNANMGMWAGTQWYLIQDLKNTGFVTQLSLGTMMAF